MLFSSVTQFKYKLRSFFVATFELNQLRQWLYFAKGFFPSPPLRPASEGFFFYSVQSEVTFKLHMQFFTSTSLLIFGSAETWSVSSVLSSNSHCGWTPRLALWCLLSCSLKYSACALTVSDGWDGVCSQYSNKSHYESSQWKNNIALQYISPLTWSAIH